MTAGDAGKQKDSGADMDVIVISRETGRTLRFSFNLRSPLMWAPVVLAVGLLIGAGFSLGGLRSASQASDQAAVPSSLFSAWTGQIAKQRQEVDQIRASAEEDADALARKLAQLQAQMMRLDAAGQRMVQIAGIKSNEFNFSVNVPVGGPEMPVSDQPVVMGDVMKSLDDLQTRLSDREREMRVLEDILLTSRLQKEVKPSGWPIADGYISSGYGRRTDPFTGLRSFHPGIDFAGPEGTPVHTVAAGIVTRAGPDAGYGNLVEVNHGNGYVTRYGHNEKILVKVGQRVHKGETIALEGSTGRSTGPHCHFEVLINGIVVDPTRFIDASR